MSIDNLSGKKDGAPHELKTFKNDPQKFIHEDVPFSAETSIACSTPIGSPPIEEHAIEDTNLDALITEEFFPKRVVYSLRRAGIDTLSKLFSLNDREFLKIKGVGPKTLIEVRELRGNSVPFLAETSIVCSTPIGSPPIEEHAIKEDTMAMGFSSEDDALCCKHVLEESEYIYIKGIDKFVSRELLPDGLDYIKRFLSEIVGGGIDIVDKAEAIEDAKQRYGFNFLDDDDIMKLFVQFGYNVYGNFVIRSKKAYVKACYVLIKKHFIFDIRIATNYSCRDMNLLRQYALQEYPGISIPRRNNALAIALTRNDSQLILCNRSRYCPIERVVYNRELIDEIVLYINTSSQTSFYFKELFELYKSRLLATSNIGNPFFLHGIIKFLYPDEFNYEHFTITKRGE